MSSQLRRYGMPYSHKTKSVRFSVLSDTELRSWDLPNITEPLKLGDAKKQATLDPKNTASLLSPLLGPTAKETYTKCYVCKRPAEKCQGHNGYIPNVLMRVHPDFIEDVTRMLKSICMFCNKVIFGDKCVCNNDKPIVSTNNLGWYVITFAENKTMVLDTWTKVYQTFVNLTFNDQKTLIEKTFPNAAPDFGLHNIFTSNFIVYPNFMRPKQELPSGKSTHQKDETTINDILQKLKQQSSYANPKTDEELATLIESFYTTVFEPDADDILNKENTPNMFEKTSGKYGNAEKTINKKQVGTGSSTVSSDNSLDVTRFGLGLSSARQLKVKHVVSTLNIKQIISLLADDEIRKYAKIKRKNGRLFKCRNSTFEECIPNIGDSVYLPMQSKNVILSNRPPTMGGTSTFAVPIVILGGLTEDGKLDIGSRTVGIHTLQQDYQAGDFDGDRNTHTKPYDVKSELSTLMIMGFTNSASINKMPGLNFGIDDEVVIILMKLSISKIKLSKLEFLSLFESVNKPFYYDKSKTEFDPKDAITAVLYSTKLTYITKCYDEDSYDAQILGKENSELRIIDGVFESGVLYSWVIGKSPKSIFSKLYFILGIYDLLDVISMLYKVGIAAGKIYSNSFNIMHMAASMKYLSILKASRAMGVCKTQGFIDAVGSKYAELSEGFIETLNAYAQPSPLYLNMYYKNMYTPKDGFNDIKLASLTGLGTNQKQLNLLTGHGDISIISGARAALLMAHDRTSSCDFVGENTLAGVGYNNYNILSGYTTAEKQIRAIMAIFAFNTKSNSVSGPGHEQKLARLVLEATVLCNLRSVCNNTKVVQPLFGRCSLDVGKCFYININSLSDNVLSVSDFYNDTDLFDYYLELVETNQTRIDIIKNIDIFGIQSREIVHWNHKQLFDLVKNGDKRFIEDYPQNPNNEYKRTKINIAEMLDPKECISIYKKFLTKLNKLTYYSGSIWDDQSMIMKLYFMTNAPPAFFTNKTIMLLYMQSVIKLFHAAMLPNGYNIGNALVSRLLTDHMQEMLDAPKRPKKSIVPNALKSIIGPAQSELETQMVIFFKPGYNRNDIEIIANTITEIKLDSIVLDNKYEVLFNDELFDRALSVYKMLYNVPVTSIAYVKVTLDITKMSQYNLNYIDITLRLRQNGDLIAIPLVASETEYVIGVHIEDITNIPSLLLELKSMLVSGIKNIYNAEVKEKDGIVFVHTTGVNVDEILKLESVDENSLLINDFNMMTDLFGVAKAITGMTLLSTFKVKTPHYSFAHTFLHIRAINGSPEAISVSGLRKSQPDEAIKHIISNAFSTSKTAAVKGITNEINSTIKSTFLGQTPPVGDRYNKIVYDIDAAADAIDTSKKVTQEYINSFFDT